MEKPKFVKLLGKDGSHDLRCRQESGCSAEVPKTDIIRQVGQRQNALSQALAL